MGSGSFGGYAGGFQNRERLIIGAATIPQLSTTLAVVFSGVQFGLFGSELMTAMVVLSMVTTFVAPLLVRIFSSTTRVSLGQ